ncbi:VCBS repeat-containing protein [candidate division KSB1 bacterium]|nr:VCBS repeat-containing protein [candidate division KSB1 bacterium]
MKNPHLNSWLNGVRIPIRMIALMLIIVTNAQTSTASWASVSGQNDHPLVFTDVTEVAGVGSTGRSFSATWVDVDNDGWIDLFVCNGHNQRNALYRNLGNGRFEDITEAAGLLSFYWSTAAWWIDLDNDGDLDLYLENLSQDQVYQNTGGLNFTEITDELNFPDGNGIAWADFNNDGWLDLYICRADANIIAAGSPPNLLFKNLGNNEFEELASRAGIAGEEDGAGAEWIDLNLDGAMDLYVVSAIEQPDHLYLNNGDETFSDIFPTARIPKNSVYSSLWADFNNDGWIDFFIMQSNKTSIFKNNRDCTLTDILPPAAIKINLPGANPPTHHANLLDFDGDGFLDLYFTIEDSHFFYHNNGDETFTNITSQVNLPAGGVIIYNSDWADFDNDGDLDLYIAKKGSNRLFRNDAHRNSWLKIRLCATVSNRDAVGTRVTVVCGSMKQTQLVAVSKAHKLCNVKPLWFGLAANQLVDSISVRWSTGIRQDTCNLAANQTIVFKEPFPPQFSEARGQAGLTPIPQKSMSAAFLDFNNDLKEDIFIGCYPTTNYLYKNCGNETFTDFTDSAHLRYNFLCEAAGCGDFNNDGTVDIYWANSIYFENKLFKNSDNGIFIDVTQSSGVAGGRISSCDLALGDFNNDGLLDIYVGNEGPNVLYLNKGNFRFEDMTTAAGVGDSLISCCTAADYDNDGDLDIYVANNRGGYDDYPIKERWLNRLYRNNGDGTFTDVAEAAGVQDPANSKGCCFGDYDNDGDLDLYVGNDGSPNRLFQNNGDGTFTDVTIRAGVSEPPGIHAVAFADFDNDGFPDIYAAGGSYIPERHAECMHKDHPDKLYHNNRDGTFSDISATAGIAFNTACTRSLAIADYNQDGALDVYLANTFSKGNFESQDFLLRNIGNKNHWVQFKLIGRKSNRSAIGARVELHSGKLYQMREVSGGIGSGGQNSLIVHFGLGPRSHADEAIITFPGGSTRRMKSIPADRLIIIEESLQIGAIQISAATFERLRLAILLSLGLGTIGFIFYYRKRRRNQSQYATDSKEQSKKTNLAKLLSRRKPRETKMVAIRIHLVPFRDELLLTYSIDASRAGSAYVDHFQNGSTNEIPFSIKRLKIQRLNQKIDRMCQAYERYLRTGEKSNYQPLAELKDIGEKVYDYFGLTGVLKILFSLQGMSLKLIVNNPVVPWQWAFQASSGQFLCERFPCSIEFERDKKSADNQKMRGSRNASVIGNSHGLQYLKDSQTGVWEPATEGLRGSHRAVAEAHAILFYGDWRGHARELKTVVTEIDEIERMLKAKKIHVHKIYQDCDQFVEILHDLTAGDKNVRLIHYSGHIEGEQLLLADDQSFAANYLESAYAIRLSSAPLVFFNGCCSFAFEISDKIHQNLVLEFLNCGASACVATSFPIPEVTAKAFALRFYSYLINRKMTAAQALQRVCCDMSRSEFSGATDPDYDITRFFYHLYGEPDVMLNPGMPWKSPG